MTEFNDIKDKSDEITEVNSGASDKTVHLYKVVENLGLEIISSSTD